MEGGTKGKTDEVRREGWRHGGGGRERERG